jgi:hypothetical protein
MDGAQVLGQIPLLDASVRLSSDADRMHFEVYATHVHEGQNDAVHERNYELCALSHKTQCLWM